jgi:hypothetical protein
MTIFYARQTNAGGEYNEPAKFAFVEANSEQEAFDRLLENFPGADAFPCECCGTRWAFRRADVSDLIYVYKLYPNSTVAFID